MTQILSPSIISDLQSNISSSPTGITWFFDRTGDPTILENFIQSDLNLRVELINRVRRNIIINNIENNLNSIARNLDISDFSEENRENININIIVDKNIKISEEDCECCICMEQKNKTNICKLNCSHTFCMNCCNNTIQSKIQSIQDISCPLCRTEINTIYVKNEESKNEFCFYA